MKSFIKIVTIILILTAVAPALAQERKGIWPEEITLDGQAFRKFHLNNAFLATVFTKDVLNQNNSGLSLLLTDYESAFIPVLDIKLGFPWLYPHLFPEDGVPRLLSISKWTKPVRVSYGLPNNLEPFQKISSQEPLFYDPDSHLKTFVESAVFPEISSVLSGITEKLTSYTGLKVSYLTPDKETNSDYAEIRIIMIKKPDNPKYHFQKREVRHHRTSSWGSAQFSFASEIEDHIKTGFVFTKESKNQVDGYFLTNSKNEIQMAVCYIWQDHEIEMLKKVLSECLIRSMGFAGGVPIYSTKNSPKSYMTYWNDPKMWGDRDSRKPEIPDQEISEFDQYMIKTLYNPALKPGMDYVEAQKILLGVQ